MHFSHHRSKLLVLGFFILSFSLSPHTTYAFSMKDNLAANVGNSILDFYTDKVISPLSYMLEPLFYIPTSVTNIQIQQKASVIEANQVEPKVISSSATESYITNTYPTYVTNTYPTTIQKEIIIRQGNSSPSYDFFDRQVNALLTSIENSVEGLGQGLATKVDTTTLAVSGNATVGGNLTLIGNSTINGDLTITGNITGNVAGTINPSFTLGSIPFQGASGLTEDNSNFFFNNTTNRLGVGTNTPTNTIDISGTGTFGLNVSIPGLAHGITDKIATDTALSYETYDSHGGLYSLGIRDLVNFPAFYFDGVFANTTASASVPVMAFLASKKAASGTSTQALANSELAFQFTNYLTPLVSVLGSGNVGIGSISPGSKLQIKAPAAAGSAVALGVSNSADTNLFSVRDDGIIFAGTSVPVDAVDLNTSTLLVRSGTDQGLRFVSDANRTYIQFGVNNSYGGVGDLRFTSMWGAATYMTIQGTSGNIGIGSVTPGGKLIIKGSGTTTGIGLQTQNSSGTALLTTLDNGNVGIGTTVPLAALEVDGAASAKTVVFKANVTSPDNVIEVQSSSGTVGLSATASGDLTLRQRVIFSSTASASGTGMSAPASNSLQFSTGGIERIRLDSVGNLKLAGTATRATTEGTNHLDIFDGTAPVGTLANGISLYSTSGELRVMDAAGNATLLSPHENTNNYWVFDSTNSETGKTLLIDTELMLKDLNNIFGFDYVHETVDGLSINMEPVPLPASFLNKITLWLGEAGNGIGAMYADVFNAKEKICVDGECLTKDDIRGLLDIVHTGGLNNTTVGGGSTLDTVPESEESTLQSPQIDFDQPSSEEEMQGALPEGGGGEVSETPVL